MASKSGSRKKSGSTCSGDSVDKDRLIAELKDRVAVLEEELSSKLQDATFPDTTENDRAGAVRSRLAAIVSNCDDAIIGKTLDGIITSWNKGAERVYGYSEAEAMGKSIRIIVPPDRMLELEEIIDRVRRGEHVDHLDTVRVTKDGRMIDVFITISPIVDASGHVIGASTIARDITGRKRAEEYLKLTGYSLDNVGDIVIWFSPDGRIYYANNAACKSFGYSSDEMLSLTIFDINPNYTRESWNDRWRELKSSGSSHYEVVNRARDGHWFPIETNNTYIKYGDREFMFGYSRDITERRRAEEALQFERLQLLSIFDSIDEVIYVADPFTYEILYANKAMQDKFGKRLTGGICYREIQNKDAPCEFCTNDMILENKGTSCRWEFHNPTVDKDFGIVDRIIKWPDGRDVRFEIALDITERKRAEEALKNSELKFRTLFEYAGVAIFIADMTTGKVIDCNKKAEGLIGRSRGEIIGMHQSELHPPDKRVEYRNMFSQHTGETSFANYEAEVQHKDGHVIPIIINGAPLNINGEEWMIGFFIDITERKRIEQALVKETYILTKSQEIARVGNWAWNLETGSLTGSAENYRIYGYEPREVNPTREWALSRALPEDRAALADFMEARARDGKRGSIDYRVRRPDGSVVYLNSIVDKSVMNGSGRVTRLYGITQDITERKRAEEALKVAKAQAELYLDLMGHDINNMHQVALGYLELARDMPVGAGQAEFLDKPVEVLQRSTKLISNVRKLQKLHDGVFEVQDVDVCRMLANVQCEYDAVSGKAITLNLNGHDRCIVQANELLHDVFSNLVNNAVKHTGDGTEIMLDVDMVEKDDKRLCRVTVEDNGPGITDGSKDRIFNRMQKGSAKGMGLGLYLVRSLVESYGGKVWAEDRVKGDHSKGARFVVMLPTVGR